MKKTLSQKIEDGLQEMAELKKRQDALLAQFNEQERKARTHRLCKRGGLVEKLLPELITLTDKQFDTFVEKALLTEYTRRIIKDLSAEPVPTISAPQAKEETPQHHPAPTQNGNKTAPTQAKTVGA